MLPLSTVSSDHNFELTMIVIVYVCFSVAGYVSPFFFLRVEIEESVPILHLHYIIVEAVGTSTGLRVEAYVDITSSGLHFEVLFPSSRIEDQSYR